MPIEVKELIIRTTVVAPVQPAPKTEPPAIDWNKMKDELFRLCRDYLQEQLEKKERR